jgi:hypothetical protein
MKNSECLELLFFFCGLDIHKWTRKNIFFMSKGFFL